MSSRSLNKVLLLGYVGNDPETRQTRGGNSVSQFSLATSREWRDHANQKQERTEWHRCIAWQGLSDIVERYVIKGQRLYVEGTVEYRAWQDKEGQTRYSTEINVKELIMLTDGRRGGASNQQQPQGGAADTDFPFGANAEAEADPFADFAEDGAGPGPEDTPAPAPAKKRAAKKSS